VLGGAEALLFSIPSSHRNKTLFQTETYAHGNMNYAVNFLPFYAERLNKRALTTPPFRRLLNELCVIW
jgi:hypothetical protein